LVGATLSAARDVRANPAIAAIFQILMK
jgi:hypothetical protein